jgi:methionyl aminopeptidase
MVTKKTKEEIMVLREGGKVLAQIMDELCALVRPGATTGELEALACRLMAEAGGRPAQKDFDMGDGRVFPTALITCINEEVVHAASLPSRTLKEGDIISIDFVMEYPLRRIARDWPKAWVENPRSAQGGFYTDMSRTLAVGKIASETQRLLDVTRRSLELAIAVVKPGATLRDIGMAIQPYVEAQGFSVIRDLVGHGVGYSLHEDPMVPNYIIDEGPANIRLEPGMVLAIEPMIAMGSYRVREDRHGFAYYMVDRKPSAHFEHTVAVTEKGHEILTLR